MKHLSTFSLILLTLIPYLGIAQNLSPNVNENKTGFTAVPGWPQLPDGWELGKVSAVAIDSHGRVYVGHRGEHPILLFEPDGAFIRSQGETEILPRHGVVYAPEKGESAFLTILSESETKTGTLDSSDPREILVEETIRFLHGMHVDGHDNLWVTNVGQSTVLKYSPAGALLMVLGTADEPGEDENHFNQPTDVVLNRAGQIFISDGYINSRIVKFSKTGKFLKTWGKRGKGKGEFNTPHAITIDKKGTLYVSDRTNYRIQLFDGEGNYLEEWTDLGLAGDGSDEINDIHWGLDGLLYGVTGRGDSIVTIDNRGNLISEWGTSYSTDDEVTNDHGRPVARFKVPHGVCLDKRGNLFVAEVGGRRAQKFSRE